MVTHTIYNPVIHPVVCALLLALTASVVVVLILRKAPLRETIFFAVRQVALSVLLFVINLRPMQGSAEMEVLLKNVDLMFVVDTTISMWAEDGINTTRIESVSESCVRLMRELPGCNFCLLTFDNRGSVYAPFTQDMEVVEDAFDMLSAPERYYAAGSSFDVPLRVMEEFLISSSEKTDRRAFVIFVSDGEITNDGALPVAQYEALRSYIDGGYVIGVGTSAGGRMRAPVSWYSSYTGSGTSDYIRDPKGGGDALSVLDEENLRALSDAMGLEYFHLDAVSDVDRIARTIEREATDVRGTIREVQYSDTYGRYVPFALFLSAFQLIWFLRKKRL